MPKKPKDTSSETLTPDKTGKEMFTDADLRGESILTPYEKPSTKSHKGAKHFLEPEHQIKRLRELNYSLTKMIDEKNEVFAIQEREALESIPKVTPAKKSTSNTERKVNLSKRKRANTYEDSLFQNEYINKITTEIILKDDIVTQSKIMGNPNEILTRIRNIKFDVITEEDAAPIVKKLKTLDTKVSVI